MLKFSIIIPVYNVAPYLRECLDSVLAQTYSDWECICVDDGSTDGSGVILDEYTSRDARFRVVHKQNEGVSVARNVALEMAQGDYFHFIDADDKISSDALSDFCEIINATHCDGLLLNPFLHEGCGKEKAKIIATEVKPLDLLVGDYQAGGWTVCRIYKSSLFRQLRFIPGMRLREDMCFWSDALCVAVKWAVASKRFYYYRKNNSSASHRVTFRNAADLLYYPVHVIRNMREHLGATDADVRKFWNDEVKGLALDPYFLEWRNVPANERAKMLGLYDELVKCLGYNPCDMLMRACVWCVRVGVADFGVSLIYLTRRVWKKLFR